MVLNDDFKMLLKMYFQLEERLGTLIEDTMWIVAKKAEIEWWWEHLAEEEKIKIIRGKNEPERLQKREGTD